MIEEYIERHERTENTESIGYVQRFVRCKDCKHFEKADNDAFVYLHCNNLHNEVPNEDWFCADGELKDI